MGVSLRYRYFSPHIFRCYPGASAVEPVTIEAVVGTPSATDSDSDVDVTTVVMPSVVMPPPMLRRCRLRRVVVIIAPVTLHSFMFVQAPVATDRPTVAAGLQRTAARGVGRVVKAVRHRRSVSIPGQR